MLSKTFNNWVKFHKYYSWDIRLYVKASPVFDILLTPSTEGLDYLGFELISTKAASCFVESKFSTVRKEVLLLLVFLLYTELNQEIYFYRVNLGII